jgi:hypothetical protein
MARTFIDDLFAVNSARLRALGVIKPDATSAIVCFGQGDEAFTREIKTWHRRFRNGRGISLLLCPKCGGKAQFLRLFDGAPLCRKCLYRLGVKDKIKYGTPAERAEARAVWIEKLRSKLAGGPLRLHPRGDRDLERRRPLELSLRRAMVVQRRGILKEVERWAGPPTK